MLAAARRRLRDRDAQVAQPQLEHMLERAHDQLVLPGKMMQLRAARHSRAGRYLGRRGAGVTTLEQARDGGVKQPPSSFGAPLVL